MGDFFGLGTTELLLIGVIAVLLYGKNLPEVGRKAGKYLADFRRGVQNIQREFDSAASEIHSPLNSLSDAAPPPRSDEAIDREQPTAPKFEPPPA